MSRALLAACPFGEAEPLTADEVTLAELGLRAGQRFLYVFDFGDNLGHEIEVVDAFTAPPAGDYPRILEVHGKASPQYATWDDAG